MTALDRRDSLLSSQLFEIAHRPFENFVSSRPYAGDSRMHLDVRENSNLLELTAVGMTHADSGHAHEDAARDTEVRALTICAGRRTPDERRAMGGP